MTDENKTEAPSRDEAITAMANQYLSNATLGEALSLVPFTTLVQLVQNQAMTQAQREVDGMTDEQVADVIKAFAPPEGDEQ